MQDGSMLFVQCGFCLIGAVVCGLVANGKGRNVAGWSICGFFFPLIGIIIVCVLPNLKDQVARDAQIAAENRRLREQLQQERIKQESFRQHAAARLDAHDQHLGLDTRAIDPALSSGQNNPLLGSGDQQNDGQVEWYYDDGRSTYGPMPATQITQLVRDGRLAKTVLVWAEHMAGWQPMSSVPEFSALANS